jgi:hypothetical protein
METAGREPPAFLISAKARRLAETSAPLAGARPVGGQILNTARATTGRVGTLNGWTGAGPATAKATATAIGGAVTDPAAATVVDGVAVLEPPSPAQHALPIEGPSDAQQSSAAIWAQVRQGHSAKTRLNTITVRGTRWSRRSTEVTPLFYHLRAECREDAHQGLRRCDPRSARRDHGLSRHPDSRRSLGLPSTGGEWTGSLSCSALRVPAAAPFR